MQTQTLTYRVVCSPDDLVAFGRSRGWFFQVMEEKGVVKEQISKADWVYQPDCITFPMSAQKQEAYKRLDAVRDAGIPIKQVIYGYQLKEERPEPKFRLPRYTGRILAGAALGILAATAGAALVVGAAMLMAFQLVDPCLIIVLDTGQDEMECPWICLSSWEE